MKKFRNLVALIMVSSLLFAGCGSSEAPVADPSKMIQESFYNFGEVKSFRYAFSADADMDVASAGGNIAFEFDFTGAVSQKDTGKPGFELSTVAKLRDPTKKEYKIDLAMKKVAENIYVKLLDFPEIPDVPTDSLKDFVGPWWKIDSTQMGDMSESFAGLDNIGKSSAELDEKGKQSRELLKTASFFKNIEYLGTESINGYDCHVYSVTEDDDGLFAYLKKVAELRGEAAAANDEDMKKFFSMSSLEGKIYIDSATTAFVKLDGKLTIVDPDTKETGVLNAVVAFSDLNQPFSVEEPTDFKVFDLGAFFGAFLGSSLSSATSAEE